MLSENNEIKKICLFANDNDKSLEARKIIEQKLIDNNFIVTDEDYHLAIAIGGDGSFLRMVKNTNFHSDVYYIGVNVGTLGFMQEVNLDNFDEFIDELKNGTYKAEEIGIQEIEVKYKEGLSRFYSLNEILIRDKNLKLTKIDVRIDNDLLENFVGDGLLIASSSGSTAHNVSYGGSIVYNTFTSLQITPIAPINSKVYRTLPNSVIVPDKKEILLIPHLENKNLLITIDGDNHYYEDVTVITTTIDQKKIKVLRLSNYSFSNKIYEKLLNQEN